MSDHPITPPPELVEQWVDMLASRSDEAVFSLAARWGADQELESCCSWVDWKCSGPMARLLRSDRRPKPPSLKKQALVALHAIATGANNAREQHLDLDTIRRALEQLDD